MARVADLSETTVVQATTRVAAIAASSGSVKDRAEEALNTIASALPSVATAICLWDPLSGRHVEIANNGYTPEVLDHLNSWFVDHDPLFARMSAENSGALRWRDVPGYRHTKSVEEAFRPAGFDEGLTARLVDRSGGYAGSFHLSSDDRRYPRDADVSVVDALRSTLASLLDVTVAPRSMARLLAPAGGAFLLDAEGRVAPMTDEPGSAGDLSTSRPLLDIIAANPAAEQQFRWREDGRWWRVRTLVLPGATVTGETAQLVMATPQELPSGITPRELDVLTLLTIGQSNQEIARRLEISPRTAVHHVENIMSKLGQPSRAGCGAAAMRDGLLNPMLVVVPVR